MLSTRFFSIPVILALLACGEPSSPSTSQIERERPVKMFTVQDNQIQQIREFPATVIANEDVTLAFRVSGPLNQLLVKPGDTVVKGQLLASIDPTDFDIALSQAKAQAELAHAKYQRAHQLLSQKLISDAEFDEAKANERIAQANLRQARAHLSYTELHAPFDGMIANLNVEQFEHINAAQGILDINNRDKVDIEIQFPDSLVAKVKPIDDYQPELVFNAFPQKVFHANIKEYDIKADPATLTYKVVFTLPTPKDFNVLPGMTAVIKMDMSEVTKTREAGVYIPTTALFKPESSAIDAAEEFVWVYNKGKLEQRKVTLGQLKDQGAQILEGLSAGETVVTSGAHLLHAESKVRALNRERGL